MSNTWIFDAAGNNLNLLLDYDVNGNVIYQGWARPGIISTDSEWRIKRLTYNGSSQLTATTFANSSPSFTFIWNNRTSYTYG